VLIGRERERAELDAIVAEAQAGRGSLVLLGGEAGVGKTALARSVLADSALTVLEGPATQDGGLAYGPLLAALRTQGRSLPAGTASPPDRTEFFEAVAAELSAIAAEHPAALFLDDLQSADEATIDLLGALAPLLEGEPLLLVAAYRSDELPRGHAVRRLRSELRRQGRLRELAVAPFGQDGTAALLEAALGSAVAPSLVRVVHDRTGGLAFFVEELGAALAAGGRLRPGPAGLGFDEAEKLPVPENVRDAVLLRAAGLGDDARAALLVAAAIGQRFDPELASDLAGLPAWPDEAVLRGCVREDADGSLMFRHALVRDAFYAEISGARRPALHRAIADRLSAAGAPATVLAEHWARGREPERARRAYLAGLDSFRAAHAYRDAARAASCALELWPEDADEPGRLDALTQLAECAEVAGDLGEAARAWREVSDVRRAEGEPAALGDALRRLASVLELQGRWDEALTARDQAGSSFAAGGRPADAASEWLAAAAHLRSAASFRAALALLDTAREAAVAAERADLEARVLGLEGNVRARMGEPAAGLELVRAGLKLALESNLSGAAAEIYQRLADSLEHCGDYRAARETYDEAHGYCTANALEPTAQLCLACLTVVLRQTGDWDNAATLCRGVLDSPASALHARAVAAGTLGLILGVRGQRRAARPLLLESATLARRIELVAMELLSAWGLATLDHARSPAAAAERCRELLERWRETEERHYAISPLRWAASVFAEMDETRDVQACAAALTTIATDHGQTEALSALAHALGEVALLGGEPEHAVDQFDRALALLGETEAPFERAESQRRAAAALLATGRREEAVERLVSAHRAARRLGAEPLAARVAGDLAALGERAERHLGRRAAGKLERGGLSRRELEVVRLVAVGRTNREIASELWLSTRTVDAHLRHILAKLDCRSRADASRKAAELGLLESAPS
jgi:ATP/maltotriose-dependent transcriptional regulator MalT